MSWKVKVTDNDSGKNFEREFDYWSQATDAMIEFGNHYTVKDQSVNIELHTPDGILLYTLITK
jgi:hypothetical protein